MISYGYENVRKIMKQKHDGILRRESGRVGRARNLSDSNHGCVFFLLLLLRRRDRPLLRCRVGTDVSGCWPGSFLGGALGRPLGTPPPKSPRMPPDPSRPQNHPEMIILVLGTPQESAGLPNREIWPPDTRPLGT